MVTGIDKFREHFAAHEGQYAIIGGTACDLLFDAAGLDFRATRDIDMVLCVEVVDAEFGRAFHAFLDAGGYQARERSDGRREFYRFHRPTDPDFPFMIELFARRPVDLDLPEDAIYTRIPVDQDIVSLSAILLDDAYFEALQAAKREGRRRHDHRRDPAHTVQGPRGSRPHRSIRGRRERRPEGHQEASQRRLPIGTASAPGCTYRTAGTHPPGSSRFRSNLARADENLNPKAFGVPFTRNEAADLLRTVYQLT